MLPSRLIVLAFLVPFGLAALGTAGAWIVFQTHLEALEDARRAYSTDYLDLFAACEDAQPIARRDPAAIAPCLVLEQEEAAEAARQIAYAANDRNATIMGKIALITGIPTLILLTIWLAMIPAPWPATREPLQPDPPD